MAPGSFTGKSASSRTSSLREDPGLAKEGMTRETPESTRRMEFACACAACICKAGTFPLLEEPAAPDLDTPAAMVEGDAGAKRRKASSDGCWPKLSAKLPKAKELSGLIIPRLAPGKPESISLLLPPRSSHVAQTPESLDLHR
eukprot:Skav234455  [mRNA]  locus=scaffold1647:130756:146606:- [translate_table: standard]